MLAPGEIAFGVFSISRRYVPAGARFDFRFVQDPGLEIPLSNLHVTKTALVGGRVAGTARNAGKVMVSGRLGEGVLCITEAGDIVRYRGGERRTSLRPGEAIRFRAPLRGQACPTFLVGAQGLKPRPPTYSLSSPRPPRAPRSSIRLSRAAAAEDDAVRVAPRVSPSDSPSLAATGEGNALEPFDCRAVACSQSRGLLTDRRP